MTVYTPHNIHFTKANIRRVVKGESIMVSKLHTTGDHPLFLTKPQSAALEHARQSGGRLKLTMSKAQCNYHLKHGGGIWDSIKKLAQKVKEHAGPAIKKLAVEGIDKLAELAKPHFSARVGKYAGQAGEYIGHENAAKLAKGISGLFDKAHGHVKTKVHDKLTDHGFGLTNPGTRGGKLKKHKKRRSKKGGSVAGIMKPWPVRQGAS